MAKQTLQTNFVDDILEESMSGKRRYNLIQNDDGTVSLEDVTNYSQIGSSFGAAQVNAMNNAINESADKSKIIDNLSDIAANQQSGMMAGALAVRELNNKMNVSTYVISGEFIDANAYKASGIKFLRCASFPKKNMSANTVHYFNAVPEDFRPSIRIVQTVIIGVGTEARLELNTDGMASITPATDISTSKGVNFLLTYI